jgi:hypothetical protein
MLDALAGKAGSAVTDKLGSMLGIGAGDYPMYDKFVSAILQDADNSIPESSHWVGFFSFPTPPKEEDKRSRTKKLTEAVGSKLNAVKDSLMGKVAETPQNYFFGNLFEKMSDSEMPLDSKHWSLGDKSNRSATSFTNGIGTSVMFLTGVELPGDGFDVQRPSTTFNVGGFLKSPVTMPRTDLKHLRVTFIENNSSLVDLVMRPWLIHSSYKSLKFAKSVTFTVFNLTKSPTGFRVRKEFTFYNVVPVSIASEDHTYSAETDYGKRQMEFVYSTYTIKEGQGLRDSLLASAINFVKRAVLSAASSVVEGGVDLVAGGASRVLTNVTGSFTGAINDVIIDTQSRIRSAGQRAEDSIIDNAQILANKTIGFNPNSDHVQFSQLNDMSTAGVASTNMSAVGGAVNINDHISSTPNPISNTTTVNNVTYTIIKSNSADTVSSKTVLISEKPANLDDVPNVKSLKTDIVSLNSVEGNYRETEVQIDSNDNIRR